MPVGEIHLKCSFQFFIDVNFFFLRLVRFFFFSFFFRTLDVLSDEAVKDLSAYYRKMVSCTT